MDKQDTEAYLNLIDQLLQYSIGEEQQILNDNPGLIDSNLVQQMLQVANELIKQGDLSNANRLMNLAGYLLGVYDNSSAAITEEKYDFLIQVLQATQDSNADSEVVYSLLQANPDKLDHGFAALFQNWATTTLQEAESDKALVIAKILFAFSSLLLWFPLGSRSSNLEVTITGHTIAVAVFTRDTYPKTWDWIKQDLGNAYYELGIAYFYRIQGRRRENLEQSINYYQTASQVFTREAFPETWARVQHDLGLAYSERIQGERADNLEQAVNCYQLALQIQSYEAIPHNWAETYNSLGNTYCQRIRGSRADNLEHAINYYQLALQVRTRKAFPEEWAKTQGNLSNAYVLRIRGERAENLEQAINYCQEALQVFTRKEFPQQWGATQNNLGWAYSQRVRGDRAENLEQAVECYKLALQIRTQNALPQEWAETQNNLGNVYLFRIRGNRTDNLEQAINCCQAVLQVFTYDAFPQHWAETQNSLGNAYSRRIQGNRADDLEQAIGYYQAALQVLTYRMFPETWAGIQNNLGAAYFKRIRGERAENLEQAIICRQSSLQVFTYETYPHQWSDTQNSLGLAYLLKIRGERAENLEQAIDCFNFALQVRTREAFPEEWSDTQNNLGATYSKRIRGERAENLEQAIDYFNLSLQVRTREAFSEEWAESHNGLGLAYLLRIRGERAENLEQAINYFNLALQVYTREAFPEEWAESHNGLGSAYLLRIRGERAENLEQAINYFNLALQVRTCEAFPQGWAESQNNLGLAYCERIWGDSRENLEQAIKYFNLALRVHTREAFAKEWADTQNNLGIAYSNSVWGKRTNDYQEQAINYFNLALQVYTREAFAKEWADTQNNLGEIYRKRRWGERAENLEQAIECQKLALQVHTRETFPEGWARNQNNLGNAYLFRIRGERTENLEQAIECYKLALQVHTRDAFSEEWAMTQNNLGYTYHRRIQGNRTDNLQQAINCYKTALQIRTSYTLPQDRIQTLVNLGDAYRENSELVLAYKSFKDAIETIELLREEVISGDEAKLILAEEHIETYTAMVEVCLELGDITKAFEYVERSKNRNLVELILNRDLNSIFPLEIADEVQQLQNKIAVGQLQLQNSQADNSGALAQHLRALREQRNELQDRYLPIGSSFKFDHFQEQSQKILDDQTAIIEWYITEKKLLAFIFTSSAKKITVWQSTTDDLKALFDWTTVWLEDYYEQKSNWRNELMIRLETLAKILHLDEIINQLPEKCDRLILVPHRFLHLFPLHALPVSNQHQLENHKVLMDCFSRGVSYAPSCQLLLQAQQRKRPNFTHLFAIQNPTTDDIPLVFADLEVQAIAAYFQTNNVYPGEKATLAAIHDAPLNIIHCAHFGCHGSFDPINPRNSALKLARKEHHQDQLLTLEAVFSLKLAQCRLVTLSACETGLVDPRSTSDEYIGLPSGFLVAGSSAVVSSLWTVDDLSTAFLMIKFYETLKQSPSPKQGEIAIALNQAQQWLRNLTLEECEQFLDSHKLQLRSGQISRVLKKWDQCQYAFADPYYWAAFAATGL